MSNIPTQSDTDYKGPKTLSTDLYVHKAQNRMRDVRTKLVGKVLTFMEAISENEQVSKARKDSVSDILYTITEEMIKQIEYEMEWLDRSIYKEETLKNSYSGRDYDFQIASVAAEDYKREDIVKPDNI